MFSVQEVCRGLLSCVKLQVVQYPDIWTYHTLVLSSAINRAAHPSCQGHS
jgi:hypothetical protein